MPPRRRHVLSSKVAFIVLILSLCAWVRRRVFLTPVLSDSLFPPSALRTAAAPGARRHGDSFFVEIVSPSVHRASNAHEGLPRVLVLTPVKNAYRHLDRFFSALRNFSYPPHLLSLGIMDSDSEDKPSAALLSELLAPSSLAALGMTAEDIAAVRPSGTLAKELLEAPRLVRDAGWRRAIVARHDFGYALNTGMRHAENVQGQRREVLARSRNHLLSLALEDEDWVLWLDSDLRWQPTDALERLLAAASARVGSRSHHPARQIIVPNCVMKLGGGRSYDLNSWRGPHGSPGDNATAEEVIAYHERTFNEKGVLLQGYKAQGSRYLNHFKRRAKGAPPDVSGRKDTTVWLDADAIDNSVVRLDAVGGAMLLVYAELHRHGLIFPPFAYRHRIETEGLSMMALDMGVLSWGMPFLEVLHN